MDWINVGISVVALVISTFAIYKWLRTAKTEKSNTESSTVQKYAVAADQAIESYNKAMKRIEHLEGLIAGLRTRVDELELANIKLKVRITELENSNNRLSVENSRLEGIIDSGHNTKTTS